VHASVIATLTPVAISSLLVGTYERA
jgi:hypothetical protein